MLAIEVSEKNAWNNFIIAQSRKTGSEFLQSWEWGLFQKESGRKIWFLGIQDKDKIVNQVLVIKHKLIFGRSYFYVPRPFLDFNKEDEKFLIKAIKEITKGKKIIFLRWDLRKKEIQTKSLKRVRDGQPSKTVILDLEKSEEEILFQMRPKTRYNIRLAQKYGVEVFEGKEQKYQKAFSDLLHQTAEREKFKIYPDNYYSRLLNFDPKFARLYLARYKNKILAGHLLIFFGKTVTYLHGASSRENREVMAPHLLHWETIRQAKKQDYQFYDFWGIDEKKWPGLTRFKKGFGGREVFHAGTFDLPLSDYWYKLYKLGKVCFRLF